MLRLRGRLQRVLAAQRGLECVLRPDDKCPSCGDWLYSPDLPDGGYGVYLRQRCPWCGQSLFDPRPSKTRRRSG